MLRIVMVKCPKCGKVHKKTKGGFVKDINDDCDICAACKVKILKDIFKK